jgi:hypothetical protein
VVAVVALLVGLVAVGFGLHVLLRGALRLGAEGKPLWNRLTLAWWRSEPVDVHPLTARFAGLVLIGIGGLIVVQAIRQWL